MYEVQAAGEHASTFTEKSDASASELQENLKTLFQKQKYEARKESQNEDK